MDENAKESIISEINPERGVKQELNRVLSKNDSLANSTTWNGATKKQQATIRDRMTGETTKKGLTFQRNGKTFIRVDKDNYRRVTRNKDVYKSERTGNIYLRDSKGRFKEVLK